MMSWGWARRWAPPHQHPAQPSAEIHHLGGHIGVCSPRAGSKGRLEPPESSPSASSPYWQGRTGDIFCLGPIGLRKRYKPWDISCMRFYSMGPGGVCTMSFAFPLASSWALRPEHFWGAEGGSGGLFSCFLGLAFPFKSPLVRRKQGEPCGGPGVSLMHRGRGAAKTAHGPRGQGWQSSLEWPGAPAGASTHCRAGRWLRTRALPHCPVPAPARGKVSFSPHSPLRHSPAIPSQVGWPW